MFPSKMAPVAAILLLACRSGATSPALPFDDGDACRQGPMAPFGRYIGDWTIEDSQISEDGKNWLPGDGARWIFRCLGDGVAVQDFWLAPDGSVGTNLRTWNAEANAWDIAWAIGDLPGFAHIEAKEDAAGNIVMMYKSPIPDPLRRITFFPPDENGWDWKLDYSRDAGETWITVYKIRATPADPG